MIFRLRCTTLTALAVLLLGGAEPAAGQAQAIAAPDIITNGDVNLDGKFDIFDVMQLERAVSLQVTPTAQELRAADVDGNGKLTSFDLLVINEALSRALAGTPMFDAVESTIKDDIGRTSDNVEIYLDLARFYRKEGILARAREMLESVVEALDTSHPLYGQVTHFLEAVKNEEVAASVTDEDYLNQDIYSSEQITGKVSLRRKMVQLQGQLSKLLKDKEFSAHYNGKRVKSKLGNVMDNMLRSIGEDRLVEPEDFTNLNTQVRQVLEDPENLVKNLDNNQRSRISRIVNQSTEGMRDEAIKLKQNQDDRMKASPPAAPQASGANIGGGQILNRNEERLQSDITQATMQVEGRIVANAPTVSPDTISLVKPAYTLHWDVSNVLGSKNASLEISKVDTKFTNPRGNAPEQASTLFYTPGLGSISGDRRGSALELEGVGSYYYRVAALNARGEFISTFSDATELVVIYNNINTIANKPDITPGMVSPNSPEYTLHWDVTNVEGAKDVAVEISKPDMDFTNPNGRGRDRSSTFFFNPSLGKLAGSFASNIDGLAGPGRYQFRVIAVSPYGDLMGQWSNPAILVVTDGSGQPPPEMMQQPSEPVIPKSPTVESANGNLSVSWDVSAINGASGITFELAVSTEDTLGTAVTPESALDQVLFSSSAEGASGSVNIDKSKLNGSGNYILRIAAVDSAANLVSSWSAPARISIQAPPATPAAPAGRPAAAVQQPQPAAGTQETAAPAANEPVPEGKNLEVMRNNTPLYEDSNPSSAEILSLNKGDSLIHVKTNGLWHQVYYPTGGKYGWVLSFNVKIVE